MTHKSYKKTITRKWKTITKKVLKSIYIETIFTYENTLLQKTSPDAWLKLLVYAGWLVAVVGAGWHAGPCYAWVCARRCWSVIGHGSCWEAPRDTMASINAIQVFDSPQVRTLQGTTLCNMSRACQLQYYYTCGAIGIRTSRPAQLY